MSRIRELIICVRRPKDELFKVYRRLSRRRPFPAACAAAVDEHPRGNRLMAHRRIEMRPDNYRAVEQEPLSPIELDAKTHWERFRPTLVKNLRAQGANGRSRRRSVRRGGTASIRGTC